MMQVHGHRQSGHECCLYVCLRMCEREGQLERAAGESESAVDVGESDVEEVDG